jgi:hypothetical protein
MEHAGAALIIAGSSLVLTVFLQVWGGSWKLKGALSDMELGLRKAITDSKHEVEARQDNHLHDVGETIAALREKIREVEMFVRDKYIEKEDFIIQMKHHNDMILMNFSNITARLDRMEKKLDQKT